MRKQTIKDVSFKGKRVLCRVDFNVPMEQERIIDDTRIKETLPTIRYLLDHEARLILVTHLGRPQGQVVEALRLQPVATRLSELLGKPVQYLSESVGNQVEQTCEALQPGELVLLENIRFHPGEEKNDPHFIQSLARLADLYVNDAFGAAHRAHASTAGIAQRLPAVAGLLVKKELAVLGEALHNPAHPFTAIIGGAKVKDKLGVIDSLLDRVDELLLGGGLANTFIKAQGHDIGSSLYEGDKVDLAKGFLEKAEDKGVNLLVPEDVIVADRLSSHAETRAVRVSEIPSGWMALDIGPETVSRFSQVIRRAALVIWNGPMGVFEMKSFSEGTFGIAQAMAETHAKTIIGGGDSAAALEQVGLSDWITHISTGGGAMLEFLEGKELPGIAALAEYGPEAG